MGVTLTQYRISIGYFNKCKFSTSGLRIKIRGMTLNILFIVFVLLYLTILASDVELNPGPVSAVCKSLSICHVNIRSLSRAKFLAIQASLANVHDIITVSETHLHRGVGNDLFQLKGYHEIIRRDRNGDGGGVAIFIKETIAYKRLYGYERPNLEAIWIGVSSLQGRLLMCCCYRPPDDKEFWDKLNSNLDDVKQDQIQNIFILGDLNADFPTSNGRKLLNLCHLQNLTCLINEPTRLTDKTATVLDQILTNSINFVQSTNVTPPVGSTDHCTVGATLNFKIPKEKAYKRLIWNYKEANFDIFRETLKNTDFDECFVSGDVNEACTMWTEKFLQAAKETVPNKTVTVRPNDSPWYTNELRKLKKVMMQKFHKFKRSKLNSDWENYRKARNEYQNGLDEAEQNYKKSLTDSLASNKNSKSWWSTVKWLLGKGGDTSYPYLDINDVQINDNQEKAQAFNEFFLSHSNIDESRATLPNDDQDLESNLVTILATEQDVQDLLKCIDVSKATGPDGISPKLLHEAGASIVPSLTRLINMSLSSGKVPDDWKIANVIPLFKKGDQHDRNNYRPVSLLSCVNKILERIVFKYLYNYLRDNLLLSKDQSGFTPGDSTVNQLSYLYHCFAEALDQKKDVHIVFCDIKKAFDRVWHKGIIYKLRKIGIGGTLLLWFIDYLNNRRQRVVIRGQESELGLIKAGVPQGSVLGPLLFLIYINDLTDVTDCKMKLFADDTSLYIEFDNEITASEQMNEALTKVHEWSLQWLVTFSAPKTKLMTCTNKTKNYPPIEFQGTQLQAVKNHKHLGLTLSSDLGWSEHITNVLASVGPMSDVLKKLKYDLDRKSLERTYFAFIRPKLEYASQIWDNCTQHDCERLEGFQLDVARIVTGARRGTSHKLLYNETNWLPLAERRSLMKLKFISKVVEDKTPQYLKDLLPPLVGETRPNSRFAKNFKLPKCRTETYKRSLFPSTLKLWNKLPQENRNSDYASSQLKHHCNPLYYEGKRTNNVKHAQLRMNCSKLNAHLFSLHVIPSPECVCGHDREDSEHFLLHCPLYHVQRQTMLQCLVNENIDVEDIDCDLLLYGDSEYSFPQNWMVLKAVHQFISQSGRL